MSKCCHYSPCHGLPVGWYPAWDNFNLTLMVQFIAPLAQHSCPVACGHLLPFAGSWPDNQETSLLVTFIEEVGAAVLAANMLASCTSLCSLPSHTVPGAAWYRQESSSEYQGLISFSHPRTGEKVSQSQPCPTSCRLKLLTVVTFQHKCQWTSHGACLQPTPCTKHVQSSEKWVCVFRYGWHPGTNYGFQASSGYLISRTMKAKYFKNLSPLHII